MWHSTNTNKYRDYIQKEILLYGCIGYSCITNYCSLQDFLGETRQFSGPKNESEATGSV